MALHLEPIDPIDEELARLLADPDVRAQLDSFEDRRERGQLQLVSHAEARRRLGLDTDSPAA